MHEQLGFLQAIIESPEDDTPRLVYADWLDDRGEVEQAVFIRTAIQQARQGADRNGALPGEQVPSWLRAQGLDLKDVYLTFRRGFVEKLDFHKAESFFPSGVDWFRLHPVRELTLGGTLDLEWMKKLATSPLLSRLKSLSLFEHQMMGQKAWGVLFASPLLSNLKSLSLYNCALDEDEISLLAASPHLAGLVRLDLGYNCIGVAGARALLDSPHLTQLKALCLEHNFFGSENEEDEVVADWEMRLGNGLTFEEFEDEE